MSGTPCIGGPLNGAEIISNEKSFEFEGCKYVLTVRTLHGMFREREYRAVHPDKEFASGQQIESVEVA